MPSHATNPDHPTPADHRHTDNRGTLLALISLVILSCLTQLSIPRPQRPPLPSQPASHLANFTGYPFTPLRDALTLHNLRTHPTTKVLKQASHPGSHGEVIRLHTPFLLLPFNSTHALPATIPHNNTLSCFDFSLTVPLAPTPCRRFLAMQDFDRSGLDLHSILVNSHPTPPHPLPPCDAGTVLFVLLSPRDHNVCHMLMRFLLAWNLIQRSRHNPGYLPLRHITLLVILAPGTILYNRLQATPETREKFHLGLLHTLFVKNGVNILITRSLSELLAPGLRPVCFRTGVILGSHANRFAFPDTELGPNMGYGGAPSLQAPLSSDALALRKSVFWPVAPPRMRSKVLYVARGNKRYRTFTKHAEAAFRKMLRVVAADEGAELAISESTAVPTPTFWEQVRYFSDASVIVGFHGAGLALSVFAPKGCSVIEIEPEDHKMKLFGNLRSSGMQHIILQLASGTRVFPGHTSRLIKEDLAALEKALRERIKVGAMLVDASV